MSLSIRERCDAIESCYEFMLAYAGQGVTGEPGSPNADQVRGMLQGAARALEGLADAFRDTVAELRVEQPERHRVFLDVLERDARASLAAVGLVLAQPAISSQLIDNLNASIHVRAMLTDLFLIDEIITPHVHPTAQTP